MKAGRQGKFCGFLMPLTFSPVYRVNRRFSSTYRRLIALSIRRKTERGGLLCDTARLGLPIIGPF